MKHNKPEPWDSFNFPYRGKSKKIRELREKFMTFEEIKKLANQCFKQKKLLTK